MQVHASVRSGAPGAEEDAGLLSGGQCPPPTGPVQLPVDDGDLELLETLLDQPSRSGGDVGTRERTPRAVRSRASRMWAALAAVLAVAGIMAVVVLPRVMPQQESSAVRVDDPLAVLEPPSAATGEAPAALGASAPVRVRIPALGVTSRIVPLGLDGNGALEVPQDAHVAGWFDGGPTPGQVGAAVLAGHVDWGGERGTFYGLRELRAGDRVVVDRADGTVATFRVDRVEEHPKDDFPTDEVYGDVDHAGLRLITCGGSFDEDTDEYQANVIVFTSLAATG